MSTIKISFNGQQHDMAQGSTLDDAVRSFAPDAIEAGAPIATAVNGQHVARHARRDVVLGDHDAITTFEPITGG